MDNRQIAAIFARMADILDILGENPHRIMAYRRAAENIAALSRPLEEIWRAGELDTIPGIGKTLAEKIDELMRTGRLEAYEKLRAQVPEGVVEMLQVPDVGPRKAALFWKQLGITSIAELEGAARAGKLRSLPGMGARSEEKVLAGIEALKRRSGRIPLGTAWELARALLEPLRELPGVVQAAPAGSLRRMRETVGDLDLLVAAEDPEPVMARFRSLPQVAEVLLSGPTKTSIRTRDGYQADLRVLPPARWGTALQYFTGSQAHNIRLRGLAQDRGLSLSEYAIKREDGREILCATEEEVYAALGLPLIPPELREDRGEIEAALAGRLPDLLELSDLQGDFQFHTTLSDGRASLWEMAQAARAVGLKYALVSDHSRGLGVAHGAGPEELRRQRAEVEEVNRRMGGSFRVLAGVEVEVRADGSLDLPDEVLAELDIVVAALHSSLRQPREQFTARAIAALRHPHVDILAHPTGRLLGQREGADIDLEAVLRAAAETGKAVEINAHPWRLDLNDIGVRRAVELGVLLAISSDAHDPEDFGLLHFGVAMARRGWATPAHILNTRSVEDVLAWVRSR
ncbi:MAG: DNA polymerase/3'-5' exonuclease PolX [Anaerolineae bacterium]|jgi:DNA polymerase (family 10)